MNLYWAAAETDQDYDNMETEMDCDQHVWEMNNNMLYKCNTVLTDLQDRQDNLFYFRCRDQPSLGNSLDRNTNTQSYSYNLIGTQPLDIIDTKPNKTIIDTGTLAEVYLEVKTNNGYNHGDSWCFYTSTEQATEDDYVEFFETGTNIHKQRLDLPEGSYHYYIQCVDLGGNADYDDIVFDVEIDGEPPEVVRIYRDGSNLRIITDEKSTCSYSNNEDVECDFQLEDGINMPHADSTDHYAEWVQGKTYYIKCKDQNNLRPEGAESCSIIVKPQD